MNEKSGDSPEMIRWLAKKQVG